MTDWLRSGWSSGPVSKTGLRKCYRLGLQPNQSELQAAACSHPGLEQVGKVFRGSEDLERKHGMALRPLYLPALCRMLTAAV